MGRTNNSTNELKLYPTATDEHSESIVHDGMILDDTLFTIQVDLPLVFSRFFHHLHHFHLPKILFSTSRKVFEPNIRLVALGFTLKLRTCQMTSSSLGQRTVRN